MDVTVSSRHVEVSDALKEAVVDKIGRLDRYLEGMDRAEVHFSAERNRRIDSPEVCEVTLTGHGHVVRAKVAAADQFAAIDAAVAKLEPQLYRLKTRLVDRHRGKPRAGKPSGPTGPDGAEGDAGGRLVKTKRFAMKPMTTEEAILNMDLLGHTFFFFKNADTGDAAVVYRRADGDIGLIEGE